MHVVELIDLQWEFFFTCCRFNIDFFRKSAWVQWQFNPGIPLYYYSLGRRLFWAGSNTRFSSWVMFRRVFLRRRLYLDYSNGAKPRYSVPDHVPIPDHTHRPELPVLDREAAFAGSLRCKQPSLEFANRLIALLESGL